MTIMYPLAMLALVSIVVAKWRIMTPLEWWLAAFVFVIWSLGEWLDWHSKREAKR